MENDIRKTVPIKATAIVTVSVIIYWVLFIKLHNYLSMPPFPLIILPMMASCWFWGLKRGLIAGGLILISSMFFIVDLNYHIGNFILEFIALAVSVALGIATGLIRKLYEKEKLQSAMLAEKHNALLKEMEERKIVEKRALWDEYFLKTMSNSSPLGILAIDYRTDEILYCNHKLCQIWNAEEIEEKIISKQIKCSEFIQHCIKLLKDPETNFNRFTSLLNENFEDESDVDMMFHDGRIIRRFTSRINGRQGEYLGRLFIYEDVTERERSEERFRLLVHNSADIVAVIDAEGNFKYNSQAAERILGFKPEFAAGKSIFDFSHPDDIPRIKNALNLMKNKTAYILGPQYTKVIHSDGSWVYLESIFTNQLDNPAINGIIINSRDFTQHLALQEALRNSRNFLNAIINSAGDPMFVKDSNYKYMIVNDAFCRLTGYKREEMLGKSAYDLFPAEEAEFISDKNEQAFKTVDMGTFEISLTDALGNKHLVDSHLITFREESGEKYIIGIVRDETRRKELETEINNALIKEKELNEMKSKFISMVSHEYRTPLTAILSSTELLELFGSDMTIAERQEHLEEIKKTVQFMVSMLNEVLVINRVESGRMEYSPSEFELLTFCRQLLKNLINSSNCRVELNADFNFRKVLMDERLLGHILLNLVSNAIKYSNDEGTVWLNIQSNDGHIDFEVKDKGIGIPAEAHEKLFEPFFRANNAFNIPGSGLGLSIVKHCTDLHKGTISFESRPGEGTRFLISLPDES